MAKVGRLVKESLLKELSDQLSEQPNFFLASVERLHAVEADTLRKQLRNAKSRLVMVKRRLGLRGVAGLSQGELAALLTGSVGFVLSGDEAIPVAKILVGFAKTNEGKFIIRGGWVDGQLLNETRVAELASLPPKPQLIAQLIGVLESPITDVIFTIEQLLSEPAWVLEEAGKKASAPPSEPAAQQAPAPQPATESTPAESPAPGTTPPVQEAGSSQPPTQPQGG